MLSHQDNKVYFHLIIVGIAQTDFNSALELFSLVIEKNFLPWISTYNFMISEFGKRGWIDMALYIYKEAQKNNIVNVRTYNCMIVTHFRIKQPEKAIAYYEEMKATGIFPDMYTFLPLLAYFEDVNNLTQINNILDYVWQMSRVEWMKYHQGLVLERIHSIYVRLSLIDQAVALYQKMEYNDVYISDRLKLNNSIILQHIATQSEEPSQVKIKINLNNNGTSGRFDNRE